MAYDPYMPTYYSRGYDPYAYNPWTQQQQRRLNMLEQQNRQYMNNGVNNNNMMSQNQNMFGDSQMVNQSQQYILKGRLVSNYEEANACMIDLDGTTFYFPCTNNGEIYTKQIGLDGNPVVNVYKLSKNNYINNQNNQYNNQSYSQDIYQNPPESPQMNNNVPDMVIPNDNSEEVRRLNERINTLQSYVNELEREMKSYVQSNANVNGYDGQQQHTRSTTGYANTEPTTELTKSNGINAVDVWQRSEDATRYSDDAR